MTIYPGWWLAPEVPWHSAAEAGRAYEFTSQLYFDDRLTDSVYAMPPYASKGPRDTRNARDGIFRRGGSGEEPMLDVVETGDGCAADFAVGLRLS